MRLITINNNLHFHETGRFTSGAISPRSLSVYNLQQRVQSEWNFVRTIQIINKKKKWEIGRENKNIAYVSFIHENDYGTSWEGA